MKTTSKVARLCLVAAIAALTHIACGQAIPTATQRLQLSTFGAVTLTASGIQNGSNTSVTVGGDISFLPVGLFRPSISIRGTFPANTVSTDREKSYALGPRFEYPLRLGCVHPYFNFLVGRGKIDYRNGGYIVGNHAYLSSVSLIYSPGLGMDVRITDNIVLKTDLQYQYWKAPVSSSGSISPKVLSLGAVYIFDFHNGHHPERSER